MAKPLPTSDAVITRDLLRAATSLQIAVYEYLDSQVSDVEAVKGIEEASKQITRLTVAIKRVVE
jgi:hypothetical protein